MVVRWRLRALLGALLAVACAGPVLASGPSATSPWYLDQYGGDPPDMKTFYAGRVGIVMPTAPRPQLFISWRNLHGLKVGQAAGERLSMPCCDEPFWSRYDFSGGWRGWLKAREAVPGAAKLDRLPQGRTGPDDEETEVCFGEAFDLATATLKDRAAKYGAASRDVKAWLDAQDAVFTGCSVPAVALPPLPAGAPQWRVKDHDYQSAALALYAERYPDAARQFAAIASDTASPWRKYGTYLEARALLHMAVLIRTPAGWKLADDALNRLAALPEGWFGRGEVRGMRGYLALKRDPKVYLAALTREMSGPVVESDVAVRFRDFSDLGDAAPVKPEILDWMAAMRADPGRSEGGDAQRMVARRAAGAHAEQRWRVSHDPAWLIAAISLTARGEPGAAALVRDAREVARTDPAWITLQYHALRLTLANTPAAASRKRLDAILARKDLSVSDRNIFLSLRTQVAASPDDFVRHALRTRLCVDRNRPYSEAETKQPPPCARDRWDDDEVQPSGIYDGEFDKGRVGFGEDARAILDRSPLAFRMAVAADRRIPVKLRLDVALTSYGRAVALQDTAAIDALAQELAGLLPLMAAEFNGVVAATPGPDKRFAEFLVLAKIPGVRTDFADGYVRPQGRRVVDFQQYWADWMIAPAKGVAGVAPPPLANYQQDGTGAEPSYGKHQGTPDAGSDLTCLGECGRGAAALRMPDFIATGQARAERAHFLTFEQTYGDEPKPPYPPGAVDVWDEMLAYATAHPGDPRVPEALHWLVHVGHFGGTHNHSGRRAFKLLHARYPTSVWAKRTPYYND